MLENTINQDDGLASYLQLRDDLQSGKVHWKEVLQLLSSRKSEPWHTAAWKHRRDQLIGSKCIQCGSTTPPFVLQHTWHPDRLVDIFKAIRAEKALDWQRWQELNPLPSVSPALEPDANACPSCGSETILFRKRTATWVCKRTRNGALVCGAVFAVPARVVSEERLREARKTTYLAHRDRFDDESGVGKEAILRSMDQHLRYMSLQDTTTLCKACAFRQDELGEVLCQVCGKNFHSVRFKQCYQCSQHRGLNS